MTDVYTKLKQEYKKLNRNTFTCRAYDNAKRRANASGQSATAAHACAVTHLRKASVSQREPHRLPRATGGAVRRALRAAHARVARER